MEKRNVLRTLGFDLEKVASRVSEVLGVEVEDVWGRGRYRHVVEARSLLCCWAISGPTRSSTIKLDKTYATTYF
jgi:hypothetical protein